MLATLILPSVAQGQHNVEGATLGVTTVRDLLATRGGEPSDTGRNVGGWLFVVFGTDRPKYTYYFSAEDSVIEWARVFVTNGYTAKRVHEALGRPDTTEYGADLAKHEVFDSRDVVVEYKPDGDVDYIEYHPELYNAIGSRRARRAWPIRDSVIADVVAHEHPALTEEQALDSVRIYKDARSKVHAQKAVSALLRKRAARLDSLCAQVDCEAILRAHRAFDEKP